MKSALPASRSLALIFTGTPQRGIAIKTHGWHIGASRRGAISIPLVATSHEADAIIGAEHVIRADAVDVDP